MSPNDLVPDFSLTVGSADGRMVVTPCGEVDVATSPALREALRTAEAASDTGGPSSVVVDLSEVTFLDASGLGVLAGAAMRARRAGGEIVLRNPPSMTVRLLEITGLLWVFLLERRDGERYAPPPPGAGRLPARDVA